MRAVLSAALILSVAPSLSAQDQAAEEPLWHGILDLAVTSASGNEQLTVVTSDVRLSRTITNVVEIIASGRNRYGESGDAVVARNVKGALRFNFRPQGSWAPSLFADAEHDPIKRLDLRLNAGGGAQYTFARSDAREAILSGAVLYSYENLSPPEGSTMEGTVEERARWKWEFGGRQRISEGMELTQATQYQPVWDRASDYLLETETALRIRVTENLALTVSHLYQRNSTPPEGVVADDQVVKLGVSFAMNW